ncbi:transporter [Actinocatenispora thailandica]|uniref:Transporter n=1 Tax=Actinocatenispora thailandica TaxID=227318 RepID=A0A7R7DU08_9ACTN|nr:RDD family protein [Actinocatenispora thailandica]BCJ37427.1 transporter [Actinocatenispora thailandica]
MADGTVVDGEAVAVELRPARLGSRMLGFVVDLSLQLAFGLAVATVVVPLTLPRSAAFGRGVLVVATVLVFVAAPVLVETLTGGRSVGKLALGLRVVRVDGGPIGFRHALTRALVGLAVEWPGLLVPPVSWLLCLGVMVGQRSGRRLGDLAAGTLVVHERSPQSWGWVPAMPVELAGWAQRLDLTALDDQLANTVRHYLARNRRIGEPARTRLGLALASQVAAQTTPPAPPGTPGWAYLAAVVAERHRRSLHRQAVRRGIAARILAEPAPDPAPALSPAGNGARGGRGFTVPPVP